jgi:hypothetical protein
MRHEMLTQRSPYCHSKGTLSQHFVMHVVPPLGSKIFVGNSGCKVSFEVHAFVYSQANDGDVNVQVDSSGCFLCSLYTVLPA